MAMTPQQKELLLQHGDKLAIGVAVAIAAFVMLTGGTGKAEAISASLSTKIETVERMMTQSALEGKAPQELPPVMQINPEGIFTGIQQPWLPVEGSMPEQLPWSYYRVPTVRITTTVGPAPHTIAVIEPNSIRVEVTRRQITVNWTPPPARAKDADGEMRDSQTAHLGYQLQKWRKGQDPDKDAQLFVIDRRGSTQFVDDKFEPETSYLYRVRAFYATDYPRETDRGYIKLSYPADLATEGKVESGQHKDKKVLFTAWSNAKEGVTERNIEVRFSYSVMQRVKFHVWQYWRGDWWRVEFDLSPGQDIGGMVSAKQLTEDEFNKKQHAASDVYRELQNAADPDAATIRWRSGLIYVAKDRKRDSNNKVVEVVIAERQDVPLRGAFGLDWGIGTVELPKSEDKGAPNQ